MRLPLITLPLLLSAAASAQSPPPPAAAREIAGLFAMLESSGCRFQRNGRWYGAGDAGRHLRRKYAYLLERGEVPAAERFITLAASKSSVSGKPYAVRCGAAAPVPAERWFRDRLAALRADAARR